jgi:hypothetical protein
VSAKGLVRRRVPPKNKKNDIRGASRTIRETFPVESPDRV